ncbi:hypothetical protein [Halorubrum salinum]|uniref:hypothetical protein n=1 Tax=Halorubrum salinum TaxID=767517 RepID=UPI0021137910|nr:hypothetical protein [Halorubrum salinum]
MRVCEAGASLALQPEGDGERTALVRLRAIYRRATAYQLPHPRWDDPTGYVDLNVDGRDALVIPDGLAGSDDSEMAETAEARTDDGDLCPALRFDPLGSDIAEGTA